VCKHTPTFMDINNSNEGGKLREADKNNKHGVAVSEIILYRLIHYSLLYV